MKMFVHVRNGSAACVTVDDAGGVKLFRVIGDSSLFPTEGAQEDFPVDVIGKRARPIRGNVNDNLRLALEGALQQAFKGGGHG